MERNPEENWHIVGVIPESVASHIGMKGKTPVWISETIAKHIADRHRRELATDNYWRVKSAHLRDTVDLDRFTQLWSRTGHKKKPVKRK